MKHQFYPLTGCSTSFFSSWQRIVSRFLVRPQILNENIFFSCNPQFLNWNLVPHPWFILSRIYDMCTCDCNWYGYFIYSDTWTNKYEIVDENWKNKTFDLKKYVIVLPHCLFSFFPLLDVLTCWLVFNCYDLNDAFLSFLL